MRVQVAGGQAVAEMEKNWKQCEKEFTRSSE